MWLGQETLEDPPNDGVMLLELFSSACAAPAPALLATPSSPAIRMMCLDDISDALLDIDERCVFSVSKINTLGYNSRAPLAKYFSQFGTIEEIYFLPFRYKHKDQRTVRRPSSMAFIHMRDASAVDAIFACGKDHCIKSGATVTVRGYTKYRR
jgi:hypothetical protein